MNLRSPQQEHLGKVMTYVVHWASLKVVIYPSLVNSDANLERIRMPLIQFAIFIDR